MSRSILVSLACLSLAVAPALVACDKSGADAQAQANEAQNKANTEITGAQVEANKKIDQAQAEADQKIAAARGDFSKTREDYRHDMQANLDAIDKRIADLDAKALAASNASLRSALVSIKAQRDAFANDFAGVTRTTALTFDDTRNRLDKEWADLKAAVDKVS
jgi:hypothetical protein